jgi:glycosyltransferase involved in cell wall biosynthesis
LLEKWRADTEVDAFLIPVDPSFPRGLQWAGRIPFLRTLIRQPFYLRDLWKGLDHADIAHIFSASYSSFLIAPLPAMCVAKLKGKKTLVHYHSGEAPDHLRRSWVARLTLAKADRLLVPSAYLVEVFRRFELSAHAIPNVVDLHTFSFRRRKFLRPHLLCTRGFHPYYCADIVVHAFAEVQRHFPEATLTLVGEGSEEASIRRLVRELDLQSVTFAGVASRKEIAKFYADADIFINASSVDNMPVSILEAFASGTPVVTTAPDCMRSLIEHERTGMLSATGDFVALAQNVVRLVRDPDLAANIAANAHAEVARFGWPEVRGQWLATYRSLAGLDSASEQDMVRVA